MLVVTTILWRFGLLLFGVLGAGWFLMIEIGATECFHSWVEIGECLSGTLMQCVICKKVGIIQGKGGY